MKKIITTLFVFAFFIGFANVATSGPIPPLKGFGSVARAANPCTCSDAEYIYMAPLFLSSKPTAGTVAFVPGGTYQFLDYIGGTVGTTLYLGALLPGMQACWMVAGYTCVPYPNLGPMTYIGTGPGGKK